MAKNKISLCMIVGNVEEYIDRCLSSFKPIADEIVVVRAIGSLTPDKTLDIAREKFGAVVGEYKNKPGHEDWPHVDDFAAARQMSFDMASNDYCFWCDSDDILESGAENVRRLAEDAHYPAYVFPYKIFARGVTVPRERLILRTAGKWKFAVHECFTFNVGIPPAGYDDQVVITHMPFFDTKRGSNDRNLKILQSIPESEMTGGLYYHLASELAGIGDKAGSIEASKKALADKNLGNAEQYEIYMNLARIAETGEDKESLLCHAYRVNPCRREALGLLAANAMDYGWNEKAMAYARQMAATKRPRTAEWNDRGDVYGWIGDDIYCQALRANGRYEEAEHIRKHTLKDAGGARITLVHATRGRPQQAALARKLWLDLAEKPSQVEHVFVFDDDDGESMALRRMHHMIVKAGGGCVAAWNSGSITASANVIVQMSDDWFPPAQWDKLILERIGDTSKPKVLAVSDGVRPDKLITLAIITKPYLTLDFFWFHPGFKGVYSDDWFTELAYRRGLVVEARDIVFKHDHPILHGKWDKTYVEQNDPQRYKEGKELLEKLRAGNDWSCIHGWFNYWQLYDAVAQTLKDGDVICEVGCWMGRSITYMAQRLKQLGKNVKIYVVDTFKGEEGQVAHIPFVEAHGGSIRKAFEDNIRKCGVADMITILEGDSAEMSVHVPDKSLAFCFIDAAHEYEPVKRDLKAWLPKVRDDGLMAGHDAHHKPVQDAVLEVFPEAQLMGICWLNKWISPDAGVTFNEPAAFNK